MQLPTVLISLEVDRSSEVNGSHGTFPATCARARFAGCIFMRHIILALNTMHRQNLRSTPGQAEAIAQYFFKNSTTGHPLQQPSSLFNMTTNTLVSSDVKFFMYLRHMWKIMSRTLFVLSCSV